MQFIPAIDHTALCKPLFLGDVVAGFPSPAESYREDPLDLNELLVHRPAATYFVRATGDSMVQAGIRDGDLLVIDRSLTPQNNAIVIAEVDGDFTVKTFQRAPDGSLLLIPANPRYHTLVINDTRQCEIFGVVTAVIHQL